MSDYRCGNCGQPSGHQGHYMLGAQGWGFYCPGQPPKLAGDDVEALPQDDTQALPDVETEKRNGR
jgi:hypothetical protein